MRFQPSKRYPRPRTLTRNAVGRAARSSPQVDDVGVDDAVGDVDAQPQAASSSWSRLRTRPRRAMNVASSFNSSGRHVDGASLRAAAPRE